MSKTRRRSFPIEAEAGWADWAEPVEVILGPYRKELVSSPADALSFMLNRWNAETSESYWLARHLASEFLRRRVQKDAVRTAFIDAIECRRSKASAETTSGE